MIERDDPGIQAFIAHLEDAGRGTSKGVGLREARTIREMLDDGFDVLEFWGPQQMDVWLLKLTRGTITVQFGIERGFSNNVHIATVGVALPPHDVGPGFDLVHFVWAIRTGANQPDDAAAQLIDRSIPTRDGKALSDWRGMVDWLSHATEADVSAINRTHDAWRTLLNSHHFMPMRTPTAAELRDGVRELEEAARA